ncbi:hypothetical protein BHM03_00041220 [Ensete ventricosum]|nr:hypothetical protein BHM03_00041220 [Ensete ventricosum]
MLICANQQCNPCLTNFLLFFKVCPICLTNPKDMAFGCGHLVCFSFSVWSFIFILFCCQDLQGMWCHLIDMPHMPSTHNYTLAAICLDDGLAPKPVVVSYLNRLYLLACDG